MDGCIKNRTAGSNHGAALLILSATLLVVAACEVACEVAATLGIFHRLEVVDLDLFFSFLSFFVFLHVLGFCCWVICFCCISCVSDTEQVLMPALDVLFWNQVIQANQFIFPALRPLMF